jgi:hypothetical protein
VGTMSRRRSEGFMGEPCHSEGVSGWQGSQFTARQWADCEGAMSRRDSGRVARDPGGYQQTILALKKLDSAV